MYTSPPLPNQTKKPLTDIRNIGSLACNWRSGAWWIISYYGDDYSHLHELLKQGSRREGGEKNCFKVYPCSLLPSGSVVLKLLFSFPGGVGAVWCMVCVNLYVTNVIMCLICTYYCRHHQEWIVSQCSQIIPSHRCSSFPLLWSSCLHWKPVTVVLPGYCQIRLSRSLTSSFSWILP